MPHGRPAALAVLFVLLAAGCTTISTAPTDAPPSVTPAPGESVSASLPLTTVAPVDVASAGPTKKPRRTPAPPASTAVQPTSEGALANLAVTAFVALADQLVVGGTANGRITVTNLGTAAAPPSSVSLSYVSDDGLNQGFFSPETIEALAPARSVDVTVSLSVTQPGSYTFTATVDAGQELPESNESDNTRTLSATAVSGPNLVFAGPIGVELTGASIINIDNQGLPVYANDWDFTFDIANTGTQTAAPFAIEFYDYDENGNSEDLTADTISESLAPGAHHLVETERIVKRGMPAVYIKLDVANAVPEIDEVDNLTSVQLPYSQ